MTADTAEREAFEKWRQSVCWPASEGEDDPAATVCAWLAWQARAALHARAPEGWVLVPREPTQEMIASAFEARDHVSNALSRAAEWGFSSGVMCVYAAMLSASPPPPEQGGEECLHFPRRQGKTLWLEGANPSKPCPAPFAQEDSARLWQSISPPEPLASPAPGPAEPVVKMLRDLSGEELVDDIAKWLHDEGGFAESWAGRTWPEHAEDTGQREGGWVKIVPLDTQARFRDVARRLLRHPALTPPAAPAPVAGGEVVAWQYRAAPNGRDWTSWMLREKEPVWPDGYDLRCFQKRPLYTTPDAELEALRERCKALVKRWADRAEEAKRIAFHAGDELRGLQWALVQQQIELVEFAICALPLRES